MSSAKKKPLVLRRKPPVTPLQDEPRQMLSLEKAKSKVAESTPSERLLRAISNSGIKVKDDGTFVTERPLLNDIKTLSKTAESTDELFDSLSKKYLDAESRKVFLGNLQKEGILDKPKKGWMDAMSYARKVAELEKQGDVASPERDIGTGDGFKTFKDKVGPRIRQRMGYRGFPRQDGGAGRISRLYDKKGVQDLENREIKARWDTLPANAKEIFRTKKLKLALSTDNMTRRQEANVIQVVDEEFDGEIPPDFFADVTTEDTSEIQSIRTDPNYEASKFENQVMGALQNERNKVAVTYGREEIAEELLFAGIEEEEVSKLMQEFPEVPSLRKRIQGAMDKDLLVENASSPKQEDELLGREGFEEEDMPNLEDDKLRSRSRIARMNAQKSSDATIKRSVMNASTIQENEANASLERLGKSSMASRGINVGHTVARGIGQAGTLATITGASFVLSGENLTVFTVGSVVTGISWDAFSALVGLPTGEILGALGVLASPVIGAIGGGVSVLVYQTGKTLYMQTKLKDYEARDKKNNTTTFYSLRRQTFVAVPNAQVKKFRLSNGRLVLHAVYNDERLFRLARE
jgi:SOS response regulatory protein OraA/RecX